MPGAKEAQDLYPGEPSRARHLPHGRNRCLLPVKKVSPQERTREDWSLRLLGNPRADVVILYIFMLRRYPSEGISSRDSVVGFAKVCT